MNGGGPQQSSVILSVDLGTTSAKVLAIATDSILRQGTGETRLNTGARIVARAERGYPLLTTAPGYAEQDPDRIAAAVRDAVREAADCAARAQVRVLAVAFSSAMHALIAVGADNRPITPCLTWADLRAAPYARALREDGTAAGLYARTGVPVHAMTPFSKLLWLRAEQPESFRRAHRFIGIKEHVLHGWFGRPVPMDESVAGGTGFYNLHTRNWDEEALRLAGIGAERLPELAPSTALLAGMKPEAAEELGLPADVPVMLGAADGVLANFGAGAIEPGVAALTVGTSGAVRAAVRAPAADPAARLFCYPLAGDLWIAGGAVNSGGVVFRWLKEKLAPDLAAGNDGADGYSRLVELALSAPPGAGGLLFLPHLSGERAPHWDERARGVFFGLSLDHDRQHMLRAGLEGILFGLRSVANALAGLTGPPREFRVSGGFVRAEPIRQLMADVLGCSVVLADSEESSALGAAKLALYALGMSASLEEAAGSSNLTGRCEPNPGHAAIYGELYGMFRSLYARTADSFAELAAFRARG